MNIPHERAALTRFPRPPNHLAAASEGPAIPPEPTQACVPDEVSIGLQQHLELTCRLEDTPNEDCRYGGTAPT